MRARALEGSHYQMWVSRWLALSSYAIGDLDTARDLGSLQTRQSSFPGGGLQLLRTPAGNPPRPCCPFFALQDFVPGRTPTNGANGTESSRITGNRKRVLPRPWRFSDIFTCGRFGAVQAGVLAERRAKQSLKLHTLWSQRDPSAGRVRISGPGSGGSPYWGRRRRLGGRRHVVERMRGRPGSRDEFIESSDPRAYLVAAPFADACSCPSRLGVSCAMPAASSWLQPPAADPDEPGT